MWFLEHDALFGGRRIWLRPGSQQLFGRTKPGEKDSPPGRVWMINNKAVSRKHVMIKVLEVPPGDGTKLHTRSQIEVTDLSCRQGTTIDELKTLKSKKEDDGTLTYDKMILKGSEHTVRLAQSYTPFKIMWRSAVFTYASRESKESKARSAQLHELDIKTTTDFLFDKTTHVVSQKRNLPKVLSGLVAGKHVVSGDFPDFILRVATTSVDEEGNYVPSKLEEDFDAWWPAEGDYVPPIGAEPVPRPQEMLEPNYSRSEVFSGLTFIFLEENQYNSLLEPITGGGGKALLYDLRPGETTVQEYVDYVHSVAGKKKRNIANGDKLPIVTVRLSAYPDGMEDWAVPFVTGVDQALSQRSILQNEFLDAIITMDRASLQRPPSEVVNVPSSAPTSARTSIRELTQISQPRAPSPEKSASPVKEEPVNAITRKRVHRPRTGGRFAGFDDYEPPPKRSKVEDVPMEDVQQSLHQPSIMSVAASQPRGAPSQPRGAPSTETQHTLRSVHPTVDKEEHQASLFPGAAKIRQQRAATRAPSASLEPEKDDPLPKPPSKGKEALERLQRAQAKMDTKEINVREHTRNRIKEVEERRRADEESLQAALNGIDIAEMRNLAVIETMDLRSRSDRVTSRSSNVDGERWNPDWNRRKNFKKFRRRGAERGVPTNKVLVTLEEAPAKKGFGVGDAFFLEDVEPSATFRSRESRRSRREVEEESEPEQGFTRKSRGQTQEVIDVEDSGLEDEELEDGTVVSSRRTQGSSGKTLGSSGRTQRVAETQIDDTQTQRGMKRGAGRATGEPPVKKGRVGRRDDESDEEETGFRFKRRK